MILILALTLWVRGAILRPGARPAKPRLRPGCEGERRGTWRIVSRADAEHDQPHRGGFVFVFYVAPSSTPALSSSVSATRANKLGQRSTGRRPTRPCSRASGGRSSSRSCARPHRRRARVPARRSTNSPIRGCGRSGGRSDRGSDHPRRAPSADRSADEARNLSSSTAGDRRLAAGINLAIAPGEIPLREWAWEEHVANALMAVGVTRPASRRARCSSRAMTSQRSGPAANTAGATSRWFQSAMNAPQPVTRVGDQFVDMMKAHERVSKRDALQRAGDLLNLVGIDRGRLRAYPHELSGGMRQRVMIAMALALEPELVIMDEPTTALDVVVQREILQQIEQLQRERGFAVLFITHDLSLLIEVAHRIAIMYAGEIVDGARGAPSARCNRTRWAHAVVSSAHRVKMVGIPGRRRLRAPAGCRFHRVARSACRRCRGGGQTTERPRLSAISPAIRGLPSRRRSP